MCAHVCEPSSQILSPGLGVLDLVDSSTGLSYRRNSGIGLSYLCASLSSLAGRYDNPMPERYFSDLVASIRYFFCSEFLLSCRRNVLRLIQDGGLNKWMRITTYPYRVPSFEASQNSSCFSLGTTFKDKIIILKTNKTWPILQYCALLYKRHCF
jgi:hypothetical protein